MGTCRRTFPGQKEYGHLHEPIRHIPASPGYLPNKHVRHRAERRAVVPHFGCRRICCAGLHQPTRIL